MKWKRFESEYIDLLVTSKGVSSIQCPYQGNRDNVWVFFMQCSYKDHRSICYADHLTLGRSSSAFITLTVLVERRVICHLELLWQY